ncbi:hypothetical protein PsorP6_006080 [Peronosclerospora sorghi]|uniref:Uncharacterized protein n=1 Tax=Peronosclerospora sorghi TaxID=230839 RepID=A0ACC0W3V3_9STRA|nr:hypothetical protein PsorP6_006080 [Peronosclerospora sorghi]
MPNEKCSKCTPGDNSHHRSAVENTGCKDIYLRVETCMKLHNGRVSACTEEWDKFRLCHDKSSAALKGTSNAQQAFKKL